MGLFDFIKSKSSKTEDLGNARKAISDNLEELIQKATSEPGLRPKFYKTLLESELIVLTDEHKEQESIKTLEKDTNVRIVSLKNGDIPVFTSTDRIFDKNVIEKEVSFIGMNGRNLLKMTQGAKLILNPFSDYGKELLPNEIKSLLDGSMFAQKGEQKIQTETKVRIGQPATIPEGLDVSLIEFAKTRIEIEELHIAMIEKVNSGESPNLVIGARVTHNDESVFGEMGEVIQSHISKGQHIDIMPIKENGGLSGYFNSVEPIYRK